MATGEQTSIKICRSWVYYSGILTLRLHPSQPSTPMLTLSSQAKTKKLKSFYWMIANCLTCKFTQWWFRFLHPWNPMHWTWQLILCRWIITGLTEVLLLALPVIWWVFTHKTTLRMYSNYKTCGQMKGCCFVNTKKCKNLIQQNIHDLNILVIDNHVNLCPFNIS